ncbi:MAG: hypothetical protein MGF17_05615 [Trichodesmium sp. MAG_R04]|nr:hypothetical protein [Trichodesmium sp. MAG_R04]
MFNHMTITQLGLNMINNYSDLLDLLGVKVLYSGQIFAQQLDIDLWSDIQKAWNNFIECGQGWALLVGLIIGWMVKSILP